MNINENITKNKSTFKDFINKIRKRSLSEKIGMGVAIGFVCFFAFQSINPFSQPETFDDTVNEIENNFVVPPNVELEGSDSKDSNVEISGIHDSGFKTDYDSLVKQGTTFITKYDMYIVDTPSYSGDTIGLISAGYKISFTEIYEGVEDSVWGSFVYKGEKAWVCIEDGNYAYFNITSD